MHDPLIDPLTGIPEKASLENMLESSFIHWVSNAPKSPYVLVLFDIDYFKAINDLMGKQQGDRVLSELGALIKRTASEDCIGIYGRKGGEEFLMAFPDCSWSECQAIAERLRKRVSDRTFINERTGKPALQKLVTITLGARVIDPEENLRNPKNKLRTSLDEADIALDYGKVLGKNRLERFERYLHKEFTLIQNVRQFYFANAYDSKTQLLKDRYLWKNPALAEILKDHFIILQKYVDSRDTRTQAVFADHLYRQVMQYTPTQKASLAQFLRRHL